MKKYCLRLGVLLTTLMLVFSSCGGNSDTDPKPTDPNNPNPVDPNALLPTVVKDFEANGSLGSEDRYEYDRQNNLVGYTSISMSSGVPNTTEKVTFQYENGRAVSGTLTRGATVIPLKFEYNNSGNLVK